MDILLCSAIASLIPERNSEQLIEHIDCNGVKAWWWKGVEKIQGFFIEALPDFDGENGKCFYKVSKKNLEKVLSNANAALEDIKKSEETSVIWLESFVMDLIHILRTFDFGEYALYYSELYYSELN